MIDLTIHQETLGNAIKRAQERNIIIPTFKQQRHPQHVPPAIVANLKKIGLWDINPLNLFRITWHNEPTESGVSGTRRILDAVGESPCCSSSVATVRVA